MPLQFLNFSRRVLDLFIGWKASKSTKNLFSTPWNVFYIYAASVGWWVYSKYITEHWINTEKDRTQSWQMDFMIIIIENNDKNKKLKILTFIEVN